MNPYIAIYLTAVVADLAATHRAIQRVPNARESHPVISRLFSQRPEWWQLALWAAIESAAIIWIMGWLVYWPLLILAGVHLYHARRNWQFVGRRS